MAEGDAMFGIHLDLPSIKQKTGLTQSNPSATLPKRITSVSHIGGMLTGMQRRMSSKNSRLGPPKQPHVTKRGMSKAGA